MTPQVFARTKQGAPIAAWLFKCNPAVFDVMADFRETGATRRWSLMSSYRNELLGPGQQCFLWISGSRRNTPAGLYGRGVITGTAYHDPVGERDYVDIEVRPLESPILRPDLATDDRFVDAEVLRVPQLGNPNVLTAREVDAIESFPQEIAAWSIEAYEAYEANDYEDDGGHLYVAAAGRQWGVYEADEGEGFDIYQLQDDDEDYVGSYGEYEDAVRALAALTREAAEAEPTVRDDDANADPIATFLWDDDVSFIFKYAADRYVEAWEADDGWREDREWPTLEQALVAIADDGVGEPE